MLCLQCGCVATKYKLARKNTPPLQPVNIAIPSSPPLQATLVGLVSYGAPGSWKREALWDEYVITIENHGEQPLTIESATLADSKAAPYAAGSDPWTLEKQSRNLEKEYRDHGEAFLRAAGPGVLIVGAGAATLSAAAGTAIFITPAIAGAAVVTIAALPVYYLSVLGINHHNKNAVMTEFNRRRLSLPLTLAPGETRSGSLFYPMVRSPGSLALNFSNESGRAAALLPLDFLHALHVPVTPVKTVSR
ncbi:MAG: hypothetical protein WA825_15285 [Steroidobacteraceae bacterium]